MDEKNVNLLCRLPEATLTLLNQKSTDTEVNDAVLLILKCAICLLKAHKRKVSMLLYDNLSNACRAAIQCTLYSSVSFRTPDLQEVVVELSDLLVSCVQISLRSDQDPLIREAALLIFLIMLSGKDDSAGVSAVFIKDFNTWFNILSPMLTSDVWELNVATLQIFRSLNIAYLRFKSAATTECSVDALHFLEKSFVIRMTNLLLRKSIEWESFQELTNSLFQNCILNISLCDLDEALSILVLFFKSHVFELRIVAYLWMKQLFYSLCQTYPVRVSMLCNVMLEHFSDAVFLSPPFIDTVFEVWWDILCSVRDYTLDDAGISLSSFLEFCFNPAHDKISASLEEYSFMYLHASDALCQILSHPSLENYETCMLPHLTARVIEDAWSFCNISDVLIQALCKCSVQFSRLRSVKMARHMWLCVVKWLVELCELPLSHQDALIVVSELVEGLNSIISVIDRCPYMVCIILDPVLESLSQLLPESLLLTQLRFTDSKPVTTAICLLELCLAPSLVCIVWANKKYMSILEHLLRIGINNKNTIPDIVMFTLEKLNTLYFQFTSNSGVLDLCNGIWKCLARQLQVSITWNSEDFKPLLSVLIDSVLAFLHDHIYKITEMQINSILETWENLFRLYLLTVRNSNFVDTNKVCEGFIEKWLQMFEKHNITPSEQLYVSRAMNIVLEAFIGIDYGEQYKECTSSNIQEHGKSTKNNISGIVNDVLLSLVKSLHSNTTHVLFLSTMNSIIDCLIIMCHSMSAEVFFSHYLSSWLEVVSLMEQTYFDYSNELAREKVITLCSEYRSNFMMAFSFHESDEYQESSIAVMYHLQNIKHGTEVVHSSQQLVCEIMALLKRVCTDNLSQEQRNEEDQHILEAQKASSKLSRAVTFKINTTGLTRYSRNVLPYRKRFNINENTVLQGIKKTPEKEVLVQPKKKQKISKKKVKDTRTRRNVVKDLRSNSLQDYVSTLKPVSVKLSDICISLSSKTVLNTCDHTAVNKNVNSKTAVEVDKAQMFHGKSSQTELSVELEEDTVTLNSEPTQVYVQQPDIPDFQQFNDDCSNLQNVDTLDTGTVSSSVTEDDVSSSLPESSGSEELTQTGTTASSCEVKPSFLKQEFSFPSFEESFKTLMVLMLQLAKINCDPTIIRDEQKSSSSSTAFVADDTDRSGQHTCLQTCSQESVTNICPFSCADQNATCASSDLENSEKLDSDSGNCNARASPQPFKQVYLHKYGLATYLVENSKVLQLLLYLPHSALQNTFVRLTETLQAHVRGMEHCNCSCLNSDTLLINTELVHLEPLDSIETLSFLRSDKNTQVVYGQPDDKKQVLLQTFSPDTVENNDISSQVGKKSEKNITYIVCEDGRLQDKSTASAYADLLSTFPFNDDIQDAGLCYDFMGSEKSESSLSDVEKTTYQLVEHKDELNSLVAPEHVKLNQDDKKQVCFLKHLENTAVEEKTGSKYRKNCETDTLYDILCNKLPSNDNLCNIDECRIDIDEHSSSMLSSPNERDLEYGIFHEPTMISQDSDSKTCDTSEEHDVLTRSQSIISIGDTYSEEEKMIHENSVHSNNNTDSCINKYHTHKLVDDTCANKECEGRVLKVILKKCDNNLSGDVHSYRRFRPNVACQMFSDSSSNGKFRRSRRKKETLHNSHSTKNGISHQSRSYHRKQPVTLSGSRTNLRPSDSEFQNDNENKPQPIKLLLTRKPCFCDSVAASPSYSCTVVNENTYSDR